MSFEKSIFELSNGKEIKFDIDAIHLERLLDSKGRLKPVPTEWLSKQKHGNVQFFCTMNALYHLVTTELLDYLHKEINNRTALEICCGNDNIGYRLGIPMCDSFMQHFPHIKLVYDLNNQAITQPPVDTIKMEASKAIEAYNPQVVIGAFVTQKYDPKNSPNNPGSEYGVDEINILSKCETYICLGNKETHFDKKIYQLTHRELHFDFLFNRSHNPASNRMWIWDTCNFTEKDKELLVKLKY